MVKAGMLSSKCQVTVPKEVRDVLKLQPGDRVAYEVRGNTVTLRRIEPLDAEFHAALSTTLEEWTSPEDERAFRDL